MRVVDGSGKADATLNEALAPHRQAIAAFADHGGLRRAAALRGLCDELFPMILPPERRTASASPILNSNAETHFSFTNALGLISRRTGARLAAAIDRLSAGAMDHRAASSPDRISDAGHGILRADRHRARSMAAGSSAGWKPLPRRVVVMHGHRHIDWIGACGALKIVSAPSPVMGAPDVPTHFHIHTLAAGPDGRLRLLAPACVQIDGVESRTIH